LDVRNAYREQGLLPAKYPHVADDHIALELGFMAALSERARIAVNEGDTSLAHVALEASRQFLEEHLLTWIDAYARDITTEAPDTLYSELTQMVAALANRDLEQIKRLSPNG